MHGNRVLSREMGVWRSSLVVGRMRNLTCMISGCQGKYIWGYLAGVWELSCDASGLTLYLRTSYLELNITAIGLDVTAQGAEDRGMSRSFRQRGEKPVKEASSIQLMHWRIFWKRKLLVKKYTRCEKMGEDEKKRAFGLDDHSDDSSPGLRLVKARALGSAWAADYNEEAQLVSEVILSSFLSAWIIL